MSTKFGRNKRPQVTPPVCHSGPGYDPEQWQWPGPVLHMVGNWHQIAPYMPEIHLTQSITLTPRPGTTDFEGYADSHFPRLQGGVYANPTTHLLDVTLLLALEPGTFERVEWLNVLCDYPNPIRTPLLAFGASDQPKTCQAIIML